MKDRSVMLLVDPCDGVRNSLELLFGKEFHVLSVDSFGTAKKWLTMEEPHILVTGYCPDCSDEADLLIRAARTCLEQTVGVVVFSVLGKTCEKHVLALGADAVVEKPDIIELQSVVKSVMKARGD